MASRQPKRETPPATAPVEASLSAGDWIHPPPPLPLSPSLPPHTTLPNSEMTDKLREFIETKNNQESVPLFPPLGDVQDLNADTNRYLLLIGRWQLRRIKVQGSGIMFILRERRSF